MTLRVHARQRPRVVMSLSDGSEWAMEATTSALMRAAERCGLTTWTDAWEKVRTSDIAFSVAMLFESGVERRITFDQFCERLPHPLEFAEAMQKLWFADEEPTAGAETVGE